MTGQPSSTGPSGRWQAPHPGLPAEAEGEAPARRGRGWFAFTVLLLVALLVLLFAQLFRETRELLTQEEVQRRHQELSQAARNLSRRLDDAYQIAADVSDDPEARALDAEPTLAQFQALHAALTDVAKEPAVLSLTLRAAPGEPPLLAFRRDGSSDPPLAGAQGTPSLPPAARVRCDLEAGRIVLLARLGRAQALLSAKLDATAELEQIAAAVGEGSFALATDAGDLLAAGPLGVDGLGLVSQTLRDDRSRLEPNGVLTSLRLGRPRWRLVVLTPTKTTSRLIAQLGPTMALAAGVLALTLVIGLGGAEARARAGYLQQSLSVSARQEAFLQGVFDAITDVLVVVDRELKVVRANRVARKRYGKNLVGQAYADLFRERSDDVAREAAGLHQVLDSGLPHYAELESPQGTVWELSQFPIFAADGRVGGVVEYARDVTQMRQLRVQLVQSEKLSTLGEMAAGIAHEINNPVGVISMFAQLLVEEIEGSLGAGDALEKARMIEEQATAVGDIVKNLLRFARKSEGERQTFPIENSLERALKIVRHQKMARELEIVQDVPAPSPAVTGDEAQLAQVILNLIVNATHAMNGQGTLRLEVRQASGSEEPPGRRFGDAIQAPRRVWVSVADTGGGIEGVNLERVFEPFFTTKSVGEGTGLGLSVSFGIVREHGGCIWVDSELGVGTRFTLDLPAAAEAE
ncbi:MAG: PAS domain-containing protein [Planctomycetes bacterium]|nr:PAS domain-containing protein [Planctomycetota bacterium]